MKDLKISRELLENVLDFKIEKFQVIGTSKVTQIRIWKENNYSDFLNDYCIDIHHFAFRCKEWAVKYNFQLVSWTVAFEAVKKKGYCQTHNIQDKNRESDKPFREDTEVGAIIKACEWVLENKSY